MNQQALSSAAVDGTLRFLVTVGECKDVARQGWVENAVPRAESVAAHMHRMAVLCMMCPDAGLDRDRMVRMALCHDMAEAVVGDVTPAMKVPKEDKQAAEGAAMATMAGLIPDGAGVAGSEMHALWHEYEAQETAEARFVRDMDLLEMVLQAHRYEASRDVALDSFFPCVERLQHPWAVALGQRILALRTEGRSAEPVASAPIAAR